jgi:alpha-glucosidase
VLGNHDRSRLATRLGAAQARVAAMLLLTLRGTPTIYQGEEIGMEDVPIPPDRVQDPWERRVPGLGLGRDPTRTPMRWDSAAPHAGFTAPGAEPWLPIGEPSANVAAQEGDPRSMLSLYRALLALRRAEPALAVGGIAAVEARGEVLTYERHDPATTGRRRLRVALNLGATAAQRHGAAGERVLLSTHAKSEGGGAPDLLRAGEGVILEIPG